MQYLEFIKNYPGSSLTLRQHKDMVELLKQIYDLIIDSTGRHADLPKNPSNMETVIEPDNSTPTETPKITKKTKKYHKQPQKLIKADFKTPTRAEESSNAGADMSKCSLKPAIIVENTIEAEIIKPTVTEKESEPVGSTTRPSVNSTSDPIIEDKIKEEDLEETTKQPVDESVKVRELQVSKSVVAGWRNRLKKLPFEDQPGSACIKKLKYGRRHLLVAIDNDEIQYVTAYVTEPKYKLEIINVKGTLTMNIVTLSGEFGLRTVVETNLTNIKKSVEQLHDLEHPNAKALRESPEGVLALKTIEIQNNNGILGNWLRTIVRNEAPIVKKTRTTTTYAISTIIGTLWLTKFTPNRTMLRAQLPIKNAKHYLLMDKIKTQDLVITIESTEANSEEPISTNNILVDILKKLVKLENFSVKDTITISEESVYVDFWKQNVGDTIIDTEYGLGKIVPIMEKDNLLINLGKDKKPKKYIKIQKMVTGYRFTVMEKARWGYNEKYTTFSLTNVAKFVAN